MYIYGWIMLKFDRKQQNSVQQLSFIKKKIKKKKRKKLGKKTLSEQNESTKCIFHDSHVHFYP